MPLCSTDCWYCHYQMHVLARYVYNLWLGMLCYGLLMPRVFILFLGQGQASAIVRVT